MTSHEFTPNAQVQAGEEEGDFEEQLEDIKRKLFLEPETPFKPPHQKQPVLIYLRIRPKTGLEIANRDPDCLHITNDRDLVAVPPKNSKTFKNARSSTEAAVPQTFTFSRIYAHTTSQKELFDDALRPLLKDFFEGQNCLVFTYGVTNSGKSYTVTGTSSDPGLLPRALDLIFNSLDLQHQLSDIRVHPQRFSELRYLTESEAGEKQQWKDHALNMAKEIGFCSVSSAPLVPAEGLLDEVLDTTEENDLSSASTLSKVSNTSKLTDIDGISFEEFQIHGDSSLDLQGLDNQQFIIYVSFAEIYNEFIYDLLLNAPAKGKHRDPLKLAQDKHRNYYIKGLHEVQVNSADEAMQLLRLGLKHRHVASTRLNYQSSRSHSIYTIKLVRLVNMEKPTNALINRISIVDLAGAERSAKTGACGVRVKEAGNINNSLLTLGKCIDAMKYNQSKRCSDERVVPFRDSKLTRLFQNYFIGKGDSSSTRQGKITMFVNVSNNASVFDETFHVLKFSALTSKVVPITKIASSCCPSSLHVVPVEVSKPVSSGDGSRPLSDPLPVQHSSTTSCSNCKVLEAELERCEGSKQELRQLRVEMLEQEYHIRQEVSEEFREQLVQIENRHCHEMNEQAEEIEDMYEKRMELIKKSVKKQYRKRRRCEEDDGEEDEDNLRTKIASLKDHVEELETDLAMERNRASAEIHDAAETYQTQVVNLNQQLVDMSLQLSQAKKNESQTNTVIQTLRAQLEEAISSGREKSQRVDHLEAVVKEMDNGKATLLAKFETLEKQTEEDMASVKRKADILELKNEENLLEKTQWEEERLVLNSRVAELERELSLVRDELKTNKESFVSAPVLEKDWELEKSSLTAKISEEEELRCGLEKELEAARSDSMTEIEILEARISELTRERSKMESSLAKFAKVLRCNPELMKGDQECEELAKSLFGGEQVSVRSPSTEAPESVVASSQVTSLKEELQMRDNQIHSLQQELELINGKNATLKETVSSLKGYEATLEGQEKHISELVEEREMYYNLNQELEEKIKDLELKLNRATNSKESLDQKVVQLSEQLEDCRRAASQREVELQDSWDQCRAVLEDQVASLRKQAALLEHELSSAREDSKDVQRQLRSKEEELLSLAKTMSCEKTTASQLTSELKDAQSTIEAMKGQHQLENAQLSIKVREMSQQLEMAQEEARSLETRLVNLTNDGKLEVEKVTSAHQQELEELGKASRTDLEKLAKKHNKEVASLNRQIEKKVSKLKTIESDLKERNKSLKEFQKKVEVLQEKVLSLEKAREGQEEEEHIYEEPPESANVTIYDSVLDETVKSSGPQVPVESKSPGPRVPVESTVLKPIGNTSITKSCLEELEKQCEADVERGALDRSKPFIPLLDRSSQLMDDTVSSETGSRLVIDATPLPVRKKAKTRKRAKEDEEENESVAASITKKLKYSLRNRKKIDTGGDTDSLENFTPTSSTRFKNWTTGKKSKNKAKVTAGSSIATRTRKKLTKDLISGPLEVIDSPVHRKAGMMQLGSRLRSIKNSSPHQ